MLVVALSPTAFLPRLAGAEASVEWSLKKQLNLEASALDIAAAPDGKLMYILTRGQLLVFSVANETVLNRIPVEKIFDRVAFSPSNNTVIVSSSTEKTLKMIQLELVQQFSFEGLPFKGPRNAPVTIAVFSDYQ